MATLVEANPHNTAVAAVVHPLIVRLTHWVNAGAMIVMIISGWQIHNAYPTLPFSFPGMLTLGDGLAGGLRWHFAAMWVLVINGAIYLAHGVISGRFRDKAPIIDRDQYRLNLTGLIEHRRDWTLAELQALPRVTQITRHICIEGWSAIGKWSGVRFSEFLRRIAADTTAKYVTFRCDDGYATSIDMPTALHPQTILAFWFDGGELPRRYGFPMKLRVPTKLGFKNPKHIGEIEVGNDYTGGYWETYGYNWFSGL